MVWIAGEVSRMLRKEAECDLAKAQEQIDLLMQKNAELEVELESLKSAYAQLYDEYQICDAALEYSW